MRWRNYFVRTDLINDYIRLSVVSVAMGLAVGLAIVGIHELYVVCAHWVEVLVAWNRYSIIATAAVGIPVAFFLVDRYSTTKASGGGSHRLLEAYHYEGGEMTLRDTVVEPVAAALTIGFGGSAGFEGPSLLLGGGIGSLIGQRLGLKPEELRVFLLSGAAAGVSAIFKAPLTGIMFALEIPYQRDLSRESFIPATMSSISAYLVSVNFLGIERLFPLLPGSLVPRPMMLVHAFLLGLLTAAGGSFFVKMYEGFGGLKTRLGWRKEIYPVAGGLLLGMMGFLRPEILGVGYETMREMISGTLTGNIVGQALVIIVLKMLATCLTLNSGGSGGVFVPTLFVGAGLGVIYTNLFPSAHEPILVVAAMAAILASANKTLLTSVAFVSETAGPSSLIITLVAAATSYFVSGNISFYEHVQPLDDLIEEEEAVHVLYHLTKKARSQGRLMEFRVGDIMATEPFSLREGTTVSQALKEIRACRQREYPVTRRGRLIGVVKLENLLTVPENKRRLTISHTHIDRPTHVTQDGTLEEVVPLLMESGVDCVFIVSNIESMRLVGIVSETDVMLKLLEIV